MCFPYSIADSRMSSEMNAVRVQTKFDQINLIQSSGTRAQCVSNIQRYIFKSVLIMWLQR